MARKHRFESDALRHLYDRYVGNNEKRIAAFEREQYSIEVALKLYDIRKEAGLTQAALAKRIGTSTSVISRMEDADYTGHSLAMLRRIAKSLGKRVEIHFVDDSAAPRRSRSRSRRRTRSA